MKHILTLISILLFCASSFAQNIEKNEINEHGVRIIQASATVVVEDNMFIGVGLEYHRSPQGIENYYITLYIPRGARTCAIKEGQEVKFKTINDEAVVGLAIADYPCKLNNGEWAYVAVYVVTPETAEKLSRAISKIRINYTNSDKASFFDIETPDGVMARYFKRAYANIKKTIPQPADKDRSEF